MIHTQVKIVTNLLLVAFTKTYIPKNSRRALKKLACMRLLRRLGVNMDDYVRAVVVTTETPFDGEF
jgi:hypothetical protein